MDEEESSATNSPQSSRFPTNMTSTPAPSSSRIGIIETIEDSDSQDDDGVEVIEDDSDNEEGNEEEDEEDDEEGEDDGEGGNDEDEDDEDEEEEDDDDEEGDDDDEEEEEEEEEGKRSSKPIVLSLTSKREALSRKLSAAVTSSPSGSDASSAPPLPRKRGRPTKAEMERRAREKAEREARGEYEEEPKPRKRGRKPMDPALKEKLRLERLKMKKDEKARMKMERKEAREAKKAGVDQRRKQRMARKEAEEIEAKHRRKPGRKGRMLTEEEKEEREAVRKAKYEEMKRIKAEKAEKRRIRNEELKERRRKKKEEEVKQREAMEKRMQELKASLLDESTQMSAAAVNELEGLLDETSQSSITKTNLEMSQLDLIKDVTAATLFEYKWPLEGKHSEHYFLQEQVSEYLGVKSFKRRYPDVSRRKVNQDERDFLVEMRVVNETQADLGLTAILSGDVLDIMSRDFYEKYEEYMNVVSERKDRYVRQPVYSTAITVERHQLANFIEKAVQETADWNKRMNQERKEKRKAYFDMQTFAIHYPKTGTGKMKVIEKPQLGHYPIALIPGQFTDHYRSYSANQMKYMPLNTAMKTAPKKPQAFHMAMASAKVMKRQQAKLKGGKAAKRPRSDDSSSDSSSSDSSSSDSSDDDDDSISSASESSSDESDVGVLEEKPKPKIPKVLPSPKDPVSKATKKIDADVPGATCKNCQGDRRRNKLGQAEVLLHCSKCDSSSHPTCVGLNIELLQFVTSYNWECTDCKNCSKCNDHTDEEKMLFCDLCDRGYHSYCVGLDEIPSGRWHCVECSLCSLCGETDPLGGLQVTDELITSMRGKKLDWVFEFKPGSSGGKIYSHTMCIPCHRLWKKTQFCPECNICFGREGAGNRGKDLFDKKTSEVEYSFCWVCSRQHHAICIGEAPRFICQACQQRTQAKCVGLAGNVTSISTELASGSGASNTSFNFGTPTTSYSSFQRPRRLASKEDSLEARNDITTTIRRTPSVDQPSAPVVCDICSKTYKNRATLYSHKNRDHGLRSPAISK